MTQDPHFTIEQAMRAIEILGREQILSSRLRAQENQTVETLDLEIPLLGGKFKATFTFDGTQDK